MPVSASGVIYPFETMGNTIPIQDQLTNDSQMMGMVSPMGVPAENTIPESGVNYLWYMLAVVILLVILKYATEHQKVNMTVAHIHIGVYNWIAIGILATLFIWVEKIILNKYPVKGMTQLVNAL